MGLYIELLSAIKTVADNLHSIKLGELKLGEFVILNVVYMA